MPSLLEVIARLHDIPVADRLSKGPVIYARRPRTPQSEALVLVGDDVPDGTTTIAREVVEVWSTWRNGARPTVEEATRAIIYYGEHDAYQPVE